MPNEQQEVVDKLKALLMKKYGEASIENQRKLFDHYDRNHDGNLSPSELEDLLADADIGNRFTRAAWVRGIIGKLDTNGDKLISWTELLAVTR